LDIGCGNARFNKEIKNPKFVLGIASAKIRLKLVKEHETDKMKFKAR